MARVKHDPLESAKLGTDPQPQPRNESPPDLGDLDQEVVEVQRRPRYRVLKPYRVSIRGTMCDFKEGRILDSAGYDVDALCAQGLQVELVEE